MYCFLKLNSFMYHILQLYCNCHCVMYVAVESLVKRILYCTLICGPPTGQEAALCIAGRLCDCLAGYCVSGILSRKSHIQLKCCGNVLVVHVSRQ